MAAAVLLEMHRTLDRMGLAMVDVELLAARVALARPAEPIGAEFVGIALELFAQEYLVEAFEHLHLADIAAALTVHFAEAEPAVEDSLKHFVAVDAHFVENSLAVELAVVPLVAAVAAPEAVELAAVDIVK